MPELPEVETTRRGIEPHVLGQTIASVLIRNRNLRWPVPRSLDRRLRGNRIDHVGRRGKYILLRATSGTILVHLGMSGSLRIVNGDSVAGKHDHVDIIFTNGKCLRLRDPRRFGSVLWAGQRPFQHKLLRSLGPEPLEDEFNSLYLYETTRRRKLAIKALIMDSRMVVGVGNIYASEALYRCGIDPRRAAGRISLSRYDKLVQAIKQVLDDAIGDGGTTLRDFVNGEGSPGYFGLKLNVYGRPNQPCYACNNPIHQITQGQRSTYFCPKCQH